MRDITETIEHVSFEGNNKVVYDVEINYFEDELTELDVLSINGVDREKLSEYFVETIENEIIEDMFAERNGDAIV